MRSPTCTALLHDIRTAIFASQPDRFKRQRGVMPPAATMICLLSMTAAGMATGYESMLGIMFTTLGTMLGWTATPATSSFCRARKKLTDAMFDQLRSAIHHAAGRALNDYMPRIRGHRVVAIDGSWITAPNSPHLRKVLGLHRIGPKHHSMKRPQVLLVVLTDALTRLPIARVVLPGNGSERDAAKELLHHLKHDDILLADRGYQGREMLAAIHATSCRYVLRVPRGKGAWREFRALQTRRVRDATVNVRVADQQIRIRHIRVSGGPGRPRVNSKRETQFLLTNLPTSWSAKRISALYAARWGIETMFRELKVTLEGAKLTSRTVAGVIQELDACCIHLIIASYLDIAALTEAGSIAMRSHLTVNRSALLMIIMIILILPDDNPERRKRAAMASIALAQRAQRKRPGRYAPRKKKMFSK